MKKILAGIIMAVLLIGCTSDGNNEDGIHVLNNRLFEIQLMEILLNQEEFIGTTIRYEGIFISAPWLSVDETIFIVYRYVDGCCGPEPRGMEVYLNDIEPLPDNTEVEVTGVISQFEADGRSFLRLDVISLVESSG